MTHTASRTNESLREELEIWSPLYEILLHISVGNYFQCIMRTVIYTIITSCEV